MVNKTEHIFWVLIFWGVFPIMFFLAGWWISIGKVPENKIFIFAFAGLGLGILIDIILFKKIWNNIFNFGNFLLVLVCLFYSVCIFGFFMGVSVFNLIMGIVAGAYIARKSGFNNISKEDFKRQIHFVSVFTSVVMFLVCSASAFLALFDKYTVSSIKGVFGFEIPYLSLVFIIIFGGLLLIVFQYFLTKGSGILFYKNMKQ